MVMGAASAALLLTEELVRRPSPIRTSVAFVASSNATPVVLALILGMIAAIRLGPTDRALGRDSYLRIAGVSPARQATMSLMRSYRDSALATVVFVGAATLGARVLLPQAPLPEAYEPWAFARAAPVLAEVVVACWLVAAAGLVAGVVQLASHLGLNRLVVGCLGPLSPILIVVVLPGAAGRAVESMFAPRLWSRIHPFGWWSWAGAGVLWGVAAVVAAVLAVSVAGRWRS